MESTKEKISTLPLPKSISEILNTSYNYERVKLSKREKIKRLRKSLENGNLIGVAIREATLNAMILHDWKKSSHLDRLAKLIGVAQDRGQQVRNDIVEDAQFRRLALGLASGTEYEFYLTNRRTDRWKKIHEFGSTQGAPVLLKPPMINYISVSVNSKEPIDVKVENKPAEQTGNWPRCMIAGIDYPLEPKFADAVIPIIRARETPAGLPVRTRVLEGGRGGVKSWTFAQHAVCEAAFSSYQYLCAREVQASIKDSVHHLLVKQINRLNLAPLFEITDNEIRGVYGSRFIFKGLRHNLDEIKSTEGIHRCWVEEARKFPGRAGRPGADHPRKRFRDVDLIQPKGRTELHIPKNCCKPSTRLHTRALDIPKPLPGRTTGAKMEPDR